MEKPTFWWPMPSRVSPAGFKKVELVWVASISSSVESFGRSPFGVPRSLPFLSQLRYDLRKLKGHALLERDGSRYAYRLTAKGLEVGLLFLFFHKRLCGPLANSRFHHQPDSRHRPDSRLEAAYHRADAAIQKVVDLLATA